tara:strand:- start:21 stop:527 length:507 start_codon:yes stop_codon:yes gene_type:complete
MDRYTKTILTVIAIALISIAAKDVNLFPIAEAQQGWEIDNELAMMDGSMQALPEALGLAYICRSRFVPSMAGTNDINGYYGHLYVRFRTAPQCMGDYIGSGRMYSTGAWSSLSDDRFLFSENQMLTLYDLTSRAAENGQRVLYYRCSSDKTNCLKFLEFRGDPADVAD